LRFTASPCLRSNDRITTVFLEPIEPKLVSLPA